MIKHIINAFLPFALAGAILLSVLLLPKYPVMLTSCISPDMPLHYDLAGWHGTKTQESEKERHILANDTRFSKAIYKHIPRVPWEKHLPPVNVSIVYSGKDLNASIHRPETCLPAQGHMDLQSSVHPIELKDGRTILFTRLASKIPTKELRSKRLHYIHYYVFFGHNTLCHTHLQRNLQDILDRCLLGKVQSWAYFQAGTCWAPEIGVSKEEADKRLRTLISDLLPKQIDWKTLER